MNEMVLRNQNLPDTMGDLAKFVLFGREKLNSVKAEIRAVEKLELAQEVREQKREEAAMISEAVLDAEVRLGELFKEIPKANKGNQYTGKMVSDSGVANQSKKEVIEELGFTKKQAERFETLADNKDIVELVKAEARENGGIPTRARVLDMAALLKNHESEDTENDNAFTQTAIINFADYQKRQETELDEADDFIDLRVKLYKDFMRIIDLIAKFEVTERKMNAFRDNFDHILTVEKHAVYINEAISRLNLIKSEIYKKRRQKI